MRVKLGRDRAQAGKRLARPIAEPIFNHPTKLESRILGLLREISDEDCIDPLEPMAEIVGIGTEALPVLLRLKEVLDDAVAVLTIEEITERIEVAKFEKLAKSGEPNEAVRGIVDVFCDFTREPSEPERYLEVLKEMGLDAVPELLSIASGDQAAEADCALTILGDIANNIPGDESLLEALPLIEKAVQSVPAGDGAFSTDGGVPPGSGKIEAALSLLSTLNSQFPGNEAIAAIIAPLMQGARTKDPVLNSRIDETIKEVVGFTSLFSKGDKSKN